MGLQGLVLLWSTRSELSLPSFTTRRFGLQRRGVQRSVLRQLADAMLVPCALALDW